MRNYLRPFFLALAVGFCLTAPAQTIPLSPPGDRAFISDLAELISPDAEAEIVATADKLLSENAIPIVVVTISSMANFGFPDWRIETFARTLFDQWGVGYQQVNGHDWNRGILLLVSRDDRKARIELGADWGRDSDGIASQIMEEKIIPEFKAGDFSGGILAGVTALDLMARGIPVPDLGTGGSSSARNSAAGAAGGAAGAIGGCVAGLGNMIMMPFIALAALFSRFFGGGGRSGGPVPDVRRPEQGVSRLRPARGMARLLR